MLMSDTAQRAVNLALHSQAICPLSYDQKRGWLLTLQALLVPCYNWRGKGACELSALLMWHQFNPPNVTKKWIYRHFKKLCFFLSMGIIFKKFPLIYTFLYMQQTVVTGKRGPIGNIFIYCSGDFLIVLLLFSDWL